MPFQVSPFVQDGRGCRPGWSRPPRAAARRFPASPEPAAGVSAAATATAASRKGLLTACSWLYPERRLVCSVRTPAGFARLLPLDAEPRGEIREQPVVAATEDGAVVPHRLRNLRARLAARRE